MWEIPAVAHMTTHKNTDHSNIRLEPSLHPSLAVTSTNILYTIPLLHPSYHSILNCQLTMLRISIIHFRLLLVACFVETAKAGWWDDFSNNLATDLAPLLALFGEQVTKQFMSESTTIGNNFIFAMAPLGILTAVVSAIRVCGGASLRAFIGRAQEGGGIAEAELCSSTSRDVCELYHNGAIVRVFGRPKILEIVHDRDATDFYTTSNRSDSQTPKCGIYFFREYLKTHSAKEAGWKENKNDTPDNLEAAREPLRSGRDNNDDKFAPNPNLSFNIGIKRHSPYVSWAAGTAGFLAQASVLVFGILVTYRLGWTKDGHLPQPWAFPLMSLGTVLLCSGMFSCAFLVERSTKERVFRRHPGDSKPTSSIYVVQPGNQIVGDQTFDSFSFTDSPDPLEEYTTSWKMPQESTASLKVWLAVGVTMSGFVLQFVGLRAMHSAVSVVQLGAILLMSVVRSGLRTQRLRKDQNLLHDRLDEVEGHELDWLALQMGKDRPGTGDQERIFWSITAPHLGQQRKEGSEDGSNDSNNNHDTSIERTEEKKGDRVLICAFKKKPRSAADSQDETQTHLREAQVKWLSAAESDPHMTTASQEKPHLAGRLLYYRSQLAELTSLPARVKSRSSSAWDNNLVYVRLQAQQLKKAIESSAGILFAHAEVKSDWKDAESLFWALDVAVSHYNESSLKDFTIPEQKSLQNPSFHS